LKRLRFRHVVLTAVKGRYEQALDNHNSARHVFAGFKYLAASCGSA
jgi:hypothetical protein